MSDTATNAPSHPAKFSPEIIDELTTQLALRVPTHDQGTVLLDPFAGVEPDGVHSIADQLAVDSVGVEIEPEWAAAHDRTICGDSQLLAGLIGSYCGQVTAVVTSPAYGNRMADQYVGNAETEKCRACDGTGLDPDRQLDEPRCGNCGGTGRAKSKRIGYAPALGRRCTPGSGAALAWGGRYRELHRRVWDQCDQALTPGGWWLVNVSSFLKTVNGEQRYQPVMEWHLDEIARRARIMQLVSVPTRRMGFGANASARVHTEHIIVARKDPA